MKKMFAVLCGCMMIILAACGGKPTTDDTNGANSTAAAANGQATASTSTLTAETNASQTKEPAADPAAVLSADPASTVTIPAPAKDAEVTPFPEPIRDDDTISAEEFLNRFEALGSERSATRVNELKQRFDGSTILEDNAIYVVYLDLATLPEEGFEASHAWEGWYRWNGDDEQYSFFKGILFTEEEYNAGVLEIEVREAVAYGTTPGSDGGVRDGYWLYFRNYESEDIYDYTIYQAGLGEEADPTGGITDAKLYYRDLTDCEFDLVFELEHKVPASEDGRIYRVSRHVSVLSTMTEALEELSDDEYYVDTLVKACDNAVDSAENAGMA